MSVTDIKYDSGVGRWEPGARGRLEEAALELYVERGFECTTVAEIAERAGVTERTFFRHFADKREVLFSGTEILQQLLSERVKEAPQGAAPIEAVTAALEAAGELIQQRGRWSQQRQAVIAANPELRERELIKLAAMSSTLSEALKKRGVREPAASLAAEAGIAALKVSFERWVRNPTRRNLPRLVRESVDQLRTVTAGT